MVVAAVIFVVAAMAALACQSLEAGRHMGGLRTAKPQIFKD